MHAWIAEILGSASLTLYNVMVCRLVGKVNVVVDKRRVDRSRVRLAEVEIGDETGTVSLRARDEQIDVLEEVSLRSGAVVLRNSTLELYQGKHIRLAVTKWGKLTVYPDNVASTPPPPSKMNSERNFSLIDLSVVASEMVDQQPESSYGSSRSAKSLSESVDTGGRSMASKSGGQTHPKHPQSLSSTRRGSRDRRQPRGKPSGGGAGTQGHYGIPPTDVGARHSPSGQMRYHGMHGGFTPGFDQGMDLRQYSAYPQSRQQEMLAPASAQHHLLHQQYELQQRQLQQMYHNQDRHRSGMGQSHQVQTSGIVLLPLLPSGSFETTGDYQLPSYTAGGSEQHPSVMSVVGSSPILVPMSMAGARAPASLPPATAPQEQFGSSRVPMSRGTMEGSLPDQQPRRERQDSVGQVEREASHAHFMSVSSDDSQFSPGKMNPDATAFAPSYMPPQGRR
jgi:hypothetical protein